MPDVQAARAHHLPLSVRGGGHDWAGRAVREAGLVVDLTGMRQVDVTGRVATAPAMGGLTAAGRHGLAAATGLVGSMGITGLSLGGGYGPLTGVAGLAADNLLGVDLVLADGRTVRTVRTVRTDATCQPELFWVLRGGGGNFGVVTALTIALHPVDTVLAGAIVFPWEQATSVLNGLADVLRTAPDGLTVQTVLLSAPNGSPAVFVLPAWTGDPGRARPPSTPSPPWAARLCRRWPRRATQP